jgi:hypothetical protein
VGELEDDIEVLVMAELDEDVVVLVTTDVNEAVEVLIIAEVEDEVKVLDVGMLDGKLELIPIMLMEDGMELDEFTIWPAEELPVVGVMPGVIVVDMEELVVVIAMLEFGGIVLVDDMSMLLDSLLKKSVAIMTALLDVLAVDIDLFIVGWYNIVCVGMLLGIEVVISGQVPNKGSQLPGAQYLLSEPHEP